MSSSAAAAAPTAADKLLFTPGPLGVTRSVKEAMLRDLGSRDIEFIQTVKDIRSELLVLAGVSAETHTTVVVQGAGSMAVESVVSTAAPRNPDEKMLVIHNGAYGERIATMAEYLGVSLVRLPCAEREAMDLQKIEDALKADASIRMVAAVHCETSSGMINPVEAIGQLVHKHRPEAAFFVDAMSSFGAVPLDIKGNHIHYAVSSANKCIQGVPGFAYVIAQRDHLEACSGNARSFCFDLVEQVKGLEKSGQFRFTPATHAMLAFRQALEELKEEGGPKGRAARYAENRAVLKNGMAEMGFKEFLPEELSSYIITTYEFPQHANFKFDEFYERLNKKDLVIYPGKVTKGDCFRVGTIGNLHPKDMTRLLEGIRWVCAEMEIPLPLK